MSVDLTRRLFTADEYDRMVEAGILGEDDHVELLNGEIVEMVPIGPPHMGAVNRLNHLLVTRLGTRAVISPQNPARVDDWSQPQPDLAVLRPRADFYGVQPPRPDDVLLLIEVADSSLLRDRNVKVPIYARAGIPEVWLVNIPQIMVEVFRSPGPEGYAEHQIAERGGELRLAAFPDLVITVDEVLG